MTKEIKVKDVKIGGKNSLALIAGPCVIEGGKYALDHAKAVKEICKRQGVGFIFKSSYDKANRSGVKSYRGPGIDEGLEILAKIRKDLAVSLS